MPRKKIPCPECGNPMAATSEKCRKCKPTYVRTPENRENMSKAVKGNPKPWLKGRKRPEHSQVMQDWWTPERKEAKRQEMLKRNPASRYHGLSARSAKRIVDAVSCCEKCNGDGSDSRLGVHHRNRNKHDHSFENLIVLCHSCHMKEHRNEIGWSKYHQNKGV